MKKIKVHSLTGRITSGLMRQAFQAVKRNRGAAGVDKVGLITFRGQQAELILPPTRSVDIAAARLDELPAGGRTPLAEGLIESLAEVPVSRALIARAAQARDTLPEALRARGAEVDVLELYETVAEALSTEQREAVRGADFVTFTSSSTVTFLLDSIGDGGLGGARLVSIGPITSATLREHGLEPDIEAARHDIDGLVEALVAGAEPPG